MKKIGIGTLFLATVLLGSMAQGDITDQGLTVGPLIDGRGLTVGPLIDGRGLTVGPLIDGRG